MWRYLKAHRYTYLLAFVLLLAAAARIFGLTWGRPYSLHIDEDYVLRLVQRLAQQWTEERSLNPHASSYGTLPLYALMVVQWAARAFVARLGDLVNLQSAPLLYLGRLISACCGTATVGVVYDLGRRLYGRAAGLWGAGFLAVAVLAVRESHFYTVDTMVVFLIMLTTWCGVRIWQTGRWRDVLAFGLAMGLALSTKMVAILLSAVLLVALAARLDRVPSRRVPWALSRLVVALAVAVLAFLILNPYALLDFENYFNLDHNDDLLVQAAVVRGTLRPLYTLYFQDMAPYLYIFTNWLYWGLGLPLEVLALAGVVYSVWRALHGARADWLVLAWLLPYLLSAGSWYAKFIRYALPLVPLLCLLAGRVVAQAYGQARRWHGRALVGLLGGAVLTGALLYTLAYQRIYAQPDTRVQTLHWLEENVRPGSTVLAERDFALQFDKLPDRYKMGSYTISVLDHYEIDGATSELFHAPEVSDERKQAYVQGLLNTDVVLLGDTWRERFIRIRDDYPVEAGFYAGLFDGTAGYELVATIESPARLGRWVIDDSEAEQTFRLFDHPRVYVFLKRA